MMRKKMIAVVLALALILTGVSGKPLITTYAKAKSPTLQISLLVGKTQKIKLNNAGKKVKWTVAKKRKPQRL